MNEYLFHVRNARAKKDTPAETFIEVQYPDQKTNELKAFRSRSLSLAEVEFYIKDLAISMIGRQRLELSIPEPEQYPSGTELRDGVGLSSNHHQLIQRRKGIDEILQDGPRFITVEAFKIHVAKGMMNGDHIKGNL